MGRAVAVGRTDHSARELRATASTCSDADQGRRLLAIALVLDGAPAMARPAQRHGAPDVA